MFDRESYLEYYPTPNMNNTNSLNIDEPSNDAKKAFKTDYFIFKNSNNRGGAGPSLKPSNSYNVTSSVTQKPTPTNNAPFVTTDSTMSKLMNQRNPTLLAEGDLTQTQADGGFNQYMCDQQAV